MNNDRDHRATLALGLDLGAIGSLIKPFIHRTPLIPSRSLSEMTGADVHVKAENLQKTGAYKVRGVFNKLLGLKKGRVITASMGNHAQALAYAAHTLGIESRIIMPVTVSIPKEEATRTYGAEVILQGENLQEALSQARGQEGYTFIHPFDDEEVIRGQATIGIEIFEDLPEADVVVVPVGGGGLIAGVALALKERSPRTRVVGVQTVAAPAAYRSFHEHKRIVEPPLPTLADGIAVEAPGERPLRVISRLVDDMILVKEETIALAILLLLERMKLVVEGAGAAPLAALIENAERFRGKRVVLVASGGNIDMAVMDRILRKGLVTGGRIALFEVIVDDTPGSLHALTGIIARYRANILSVSHNRFAEDLPLGKTRVLFALETRNRKTFHEILSAIGAAGFALSRTGLRGEEK